MYENKALKLWGEKSKKFLFQNYEKYVKNI